MRMFLKVWVCSFAGTSVERVNFSSASSRLMLLLFMLFWCLNV